MTETTKKKPEDRKQSKEELEFYTFEHEGETYKMKGSFKELNKPGFLRKNRNKDEMDLFFTMLETIASDEVLELTDEMDEEEYTKFSQEFLEAFAEYNGATLGE